MNDLLILIGLGLVYNTSPLGSTEVKKVTSAVLIVIGLVIILLPYLR